MPHPAATSRFAALTAELIANGQVGLRPVPAQPYIADPLARIISEFGSVERAYEYITCADHVGDYDRMEVMGGLLGMMVARDAAQARAA